MEMVAQYSASLSNTQVWPCIHGVCSMYVVLGHTGNLTWRLEEMKANFQWLDKINTTTPSSAKALQFSINKV